jgi:3-hydroxybutyryl-CoA dehydratase
MPQSLDALPIGYTTRFSKTVGETDIYLFAGITGDLLGNHVDEEYMSHTRYGHRIAHGALLVGYMSNCSSKLLDTLDLRAVSYGYDRVRFTGPVFIGDTITVTYRVNEIRADEAKAFAQVTVTNQRQETVAVATHILKFL